MADFCKQMRNETRKLHTLSDSLVNAKFAIALRNDSVWADGLLVFYEIFKYLERTMPEVSKKCKIDNLITPELERTKAFENDLDFYLGNNWHRNYIRRRRVQDYLDYLEELEKKNPILLIAYVYHLYMGLLSGGIILRKKRNLLKKILPFKKPHTLAGNEVTTFGDYSIYNLKVNMKNKMNEIAEKFDEDVREELLRESNVVFVMNNEVIRTVKGQEIITLKKFLYFLICLILICMYYYFEIS